MQLPICMLIVIFNSDINYVLTSEFSVWFIFSSNLMYVYIYIYILFADFSFGNGTDMLRTTFVDETFK